MSEIKVGDQVIVFDGSEWAKTGDIGDNSQFWKEATILELRTSVNHWGTSKEQIADVQFKDGKISKGHFMDLINLIGE